MSAIYNFRPLLLALPATLLALNSVPATADQEISEVGALVCVNDKWEEKEIAKGHKLVDFAGRCADIPDDAAAEKYTENCVGKYEYKPDDTWKGAGTCTLNFKNGDHINSAWEEGSHLKEFKYTYSGGTGKFTGVTGGGTYTYDNLTDTLSGGRFKGKMVMP